MNRMFPTRFFCILTVFLVNILLITAPPVLADEFVTPIKIDWQVFQGDWQRTDGNYRIQVEAVSTAGPVTVHYFNPSPIHVADAYTFVKNGFQGLFVNLEDTGYQGSTYTLYYDNAQDVLMGFYVVGQSQQTFEVIFVRK